MCGGGALPLFKPGFDLCGVPRHASWCQIKPTRELTSLLHFIDGRVSQRHHLPELTAANSALEKIWSGIHIPKRRIDCARQSGWLGQQSFWFPMLSQTARAKRPVGCLIERGCLSAVRVYLQRLLSIGWSSAPPTVKSADSFRFLHPFYPKLIWRADGANDQRAAQPLSTVMDSSLSPEEDHDICPATQLGKPGKRRTREEKGGNGGNFRTPPSTRDLRAHSARFQ
jgi:hypothetical protein